MRALIQVVDRASVSIEGEDSRSIGRGLLIFLGVGEGDGKKEADQLWKKIHKLRIFADEEGKTNLSIDQVGGEVMVISQFTLYASCRKGNRPSFAHAGPADQAEALYEYFLDRAKQDMGQVQHGEFGAYMKVDLTNDGPFTILLDTEELNRPRK